MSPNPDTKNPFLQDDALVPILLQNKQFQASSKQAQNAYKTHIAQSIHKPNIFTTMSQSLSHITRFSFAALTAFTLLAGGVAAQAFAPESYKPITVANNLFSANKQKDNDPKVALSSDNENTVYDLDTCNLRVKTPNKINNSNIYFERYNQKNTSIFTLRDIDRYVEKQFDKEIGVFSIRCSNEELVSLLRSPAGENQFISTQLANANLREKTGWFVTEGNPQNIILIQPKKESPIKGMSELEFKIDDTFYQITYSTKQDSTIPIISQEYLQLQVLPQKVQKSNILENQLTFNSDLKIYKYEDNKISQIDLYNYDISKTYDLSQDDASFSFKSFKDKEYANQTFLSTSDASEISINDLPVSFIKASNIKKAYISNNSKSQLAGQSSDYFYITESNSIYGISIVNKEKVYSNFDIVIK
jgi:hypothetical protein